MAQGGHINSGLSRRLIRLFAVLQVYLPIAEISVNVFALLLLGGGVGFLSGLFGVGGGFLMTPLLIFMGISPAVAVGSQANQLVGGSVAGTIAYWRKDGVDFRMGGILLMSGLVGSSIGVLIFGLLQRLGQIDLVISILYVVVLGSVGGLMALESVRALRRSGMAMPPRRKLHQHLWIHGLPLKMRFPKSRLYISALVPGGIGLLGGIIIAVMGVGGGFFMVPAMVYIIGMPTAVVAGTSLFQILFTTAVVTLLQAMLNNTVDVLLALILLIGGVVGTQIGIRFGGKLRGEQSRLLLSLMILAVAAKVLVDLVVPPVDIFSLTVG